MFCALRTRWGCGEQGRSGSESAGGGSDGQAAHKSAATREGGAATRQQSATLTQQLAGLRVVFFHKLAAICGGFGGGAADWLDGSATFTGGGQRTAMPRRRESADGAPGGNPGGHMHAGVHQSSAWHCQRRSSAA